MMKRPLVQLTLARLREFYREPAAVFWVYCFPLLMALALGIAFRERPVERIVVDIVVDGTDVSAMKERLTADPRITVNEVPPGEWTKRLRSGKTDLVVEVTADGVQFWDEPNRPESTLARHAVELVLFRPADAPGPQVKHLEETGSRYIDFLLPGLLGMNLMGGGLWGVGYVIADMRIRKLLKRFLATPMRRRDFLGAIALSRILFTISEVLVLLLFGRLFFDVRCHGNILELLIIIVVGAASFGGLGLLVASRAKTIETVSGLMNLTMLPMYVMCGVFFSAERFPDAVQPLLKLLPLTAVNDAMRGVMLEGKSLVHVWSEMLVLVAWGALSFVIALKIFRWR